MLYSDNTQDRIKVSDVEKQIYQKAYPGMLWDKHAEDKCMINLISDYLLNFDRMVFHSVAFLWRGKVWLITAPSGTGKTTQYRNLKKLYEDNVQIICGDNPILSFADDGTIKVFSSPWTGKERYGSEKKSEGQLGGVIWLSQANTNRIELFPKNEAVYPIYQEINTFAKTASCIHKVLQLERKLLETVPIWRFFNTGSLESTQMLMNCLKEYERGDGH